MATQKKIGLSENFWMTAVGFLAILAVTILGVQFLDSGLSRTVGIVLLVLFTTLFALIPNAEQVTWKLHLHLAAMTVIVGILMALRPGWSIFPMLFFVLSPTAMMALPLRKGMLWILVFTLVTGAVSFALAPPLQALIGFLPFSAGFWFFGTFGRALVTAEEARIESQRLLLELKEAHTQLQDYATRIEELAISEERNRLSREMHDTLGHRLTVSAVQLEGANRLISNDPVRASQMIDTVREQVREALAELRRTVATLREPLEADLSLEISLGRLVKYFQEATDLTIHLEIPKDSTLIPHIHRLSLYRAAQEALTNIQKHAQAENAWLNIQIRPDSVCLTVIDDGTGYPDKVRETAFGLMGMRERAAHLGGSLQLGKGKAGGAKLQMTLPLPKKMTNE